MVKNQKDLKKRNIVIKNIEVVQSVEPACYQQGVSTVFFLISAPDAFEMKMQKLLLFNAILQ